MANPFTLVGLDIEGDWNRPLLAKAAQLSACDCLFASSSQDSLPQTLPIAELLQGYSQVIACESTHSSSSIYTLPAPRTRTAILVGNEQSGISRETLKKADRIISVPMVTGGLTSLNVAVAASIILYVLTHDLARQRIPKAELRQSNVDVLITAPNDPHELGSLLRSVCAFGWRRVFVHDSHRVWFSEDPDVILKGRAAARRAKNHIAVIPAGQMDLHRYDGILVCMQEQQGARLSKLRIDDYKHLLIVLGGWPEELGTTTPFAPFFVDHIARDAHGPFRHEGSIALSVLSQRFLT